MTLKSALSAVVQWFNPFSESVAKVAPHIEAEIKRIIADAENKASALRAAHSTEVHSANLKAELAEAKRVYDRYVELLKADATAKIAGTSVVLPTVSEQFGVSGPTGA